MGLNREESFGVVPLRRDRDDWQVFLILHKVGDHWGFPKGGADPEETPLDSAVRELKEETGLQVEKLLVEAPILETYTFFRNRAKVVKKVHYFPAVVSGALLLQPEEIRDGKWLSFEKAQELLTFEEARRLLSHIQDLVSSLYP